MEVTEDTLKTLFDQLLQQTTAENKANPIFKHLCDQFSSISTAEDFHTLAIYPIQSIVRTFVTLKVGEKMPLTTSIHTDYDFYERHVAEVCTRLYGSACSVDKARHLLQCAMTWERTSTLPVFDFTKEYTYHYPSTGTPLQWMEFIKALRGLLHGKYDRYILALDSLMRIGKTGKS